MEIEIMFSVTTEYSWTGELTDLPKEIRKGGKLTRREDGETVLNDDVLDERLDGNLHLLIKTAEESDTQYELQSVEEC